MMIKNDVQMKKVKPNKKIYNVSHPTLVYMAGSIDSRSSHGLIRLNQVMDLS